MSGLGIRLTEHARDVMKRRSVTFQQIVDAISQPEIIEPHKGKSRYVKGNLCVVVASSLHGKVIITILLRDPENWTDHDARNR